MRIFLLAVLSLSLSGVLAQPQRCSFQTPHQADNWLFHQNIGLKFGDRGATLNHPAGNNLPDGKGTASISDEKGELLFYTDGITIWNKANQKINENAPLKGSNHSTQSSLIVPRPGSKTDYFIFTTDLASYPTYTTKGFNYSMVKIFQDGIQFEISDKWNLNLLPESTEMLSGVEHANGIDYWVVIHGVNGNSFHAFLVDSSGVNETAIVSSAGAVIDGNSISGKSFGAMKLSPKGDKIAYASYGKKVVEVFSFDNNTGVVSSNPLFNNPTLIETDNYGPYYVEFSPDGTKLYYTITYLSGVDNQLYQYDLINGGQSVLLNDPQLLLYSDVTALQLARDGKIYVARMNKNMLGVIENPNRAGRACNYNQDGLALGSKKSQLGLTNFIQSYFDIPAFDYDTKCLGDKTTFSILNKSNIDGVSWDFGDIQNPASSAGLNPTHIYSDSGQYIVTLTETYNGEDFITSIPVMIHPLPPKPLEAKGDSMYLFPGSRVPLDAGGGMFSYTWQDGSNDQIYEVDKEGDIQVMVEDINCCYNTGSLKVISLAITLPNAFTPNGDDLNQEFFAFGPNDGVENFNLKVYNNWGQIVWETNNFTQGWDGTIKGQLALPGLYTWLLGFDVIGDLTGIGRVKYKGTVTLLR